MKLGVISDTHGVLREEVVERLQECDYIIHAGDIGNKDIIDKLESITKTFVVRGNNDDDEWGLTLPEYREIEMDEVLIYVAHNKEDIPKDLKEVDLVMVGGTERIFGFNGLTEAQINEDTLFPSLENAKLRKFI